MLGVNHEMRDFATAGRRTSTWSLHARTVRSRQALSLLRVWLRYYRIQLTVGEQNALNALPDILVAPVGAVLVALEAKA